METSASTARRKRRVSGFTTRPSHLERLKTDNGEAWDEFYRKYHAMIHAIGRRLQLPESDSEDLMQEVAAVCHQRLRDFVYEPERCRFRSFLFRVTVNIATNLRRKKNRIVAADPTAPKYAMPEIDETFLREYEDFMMEQALRRLKESVDSETYLAFELLFLEKRPVPEVASITGKSANALYTTKHRCLKKLRACIAAMQQELETPPETPR